MWGADLCRDQMTVAVSQQQGSPWGGENSSTPQLPAPADMLSACHPKTMKFSPGFQMIALPSPSWRSESQIPLKAATDGFKLVPSESHN